MTYFRRSTNKGFEHEYRFQLADGTTVTKAASEIPSLGSRDLPHARDDSV